MSWQKEWKICKKILCVRLDNLGDVILTTPVLRALKESFPNVYITLLTTEKGEKIVPFIPYINDAIVYNPPWIENPTLQTYNNNFEVIETIKYKSYDGAIILTNFSQSSLPAAQLLFLAKINKILAYSREFPGKLISHWVVDKEPFSYPTHAVERQLRLVGSIGAKTHDTSLSLKIDKSRFAFVKRRLSSKGIVIPNNFLIMHPGASLKRRQYLLSSFIEAGKKLVASGHFVFITGNEREKINTIQVQEKIGKNAYSVAGDLSIEELIVFIVHADVLISNNTAPVHIASAVGTPVVDLYARSNPEHTPWKVPNRVIYFDISYNLMTKNTLLLETIPKTKSPMPKPSHIVMAVNELLEKTTTTFLPKSITTWNSEKIEEKKEVRDTTILIPTYNRPYALAMLLTSLCSQTYQEFSIVISNQSSENRYKIKALNAVLRILSAHKHKIKIYNHFPKKGIAEQRQFLLTKSHSKYSLFLDDDLILEPWVIDNLVQTIKKEECGFVGQAVIGLSFINDIRLNEQQIEFWQEKVKPEKVTPFTRKWDRYKLHNAANIFHVQQSLNLSSDDIRAYKIAWIGGCVLYDTKKLCNVGGFSFWRDLPKKHVGEDVLAQLRVMEKYGGCGIIPSGVYHQELPTTLPNRKMNAPEYFL